MPKLNMTPSTLLVYKRQRKLVFCPMTKRLEGCGPTMADFFMCGIGCDARAFLHNGVGHVPKARTLLESLRVKGFPNRSEGGRVYTKTKDKVNQYSAQATKRSEGCGTTMADFRMWNRMLCPRLPAQGGLLAKFQFLWDARPFQGRCNPFRGVSQTTNATPIAW
jgi:hypothetical protein